MPQRIVREASSLGPRRPRVSRLARKVTIEHAPGNLASLLRGLYRRVADRLGLDASYVSRVARGERRSSIVDDGLRRELNQIVRKINEQYAGTAKKLARKSR